MAAVNIPFFFLIFARFALCFQAIPPANSTAGNLGSKDDGKSSLVFVFDTTRSMYNDLRQLRDGAEMILQTALEDSSAISNFVFVPFNDPVVGPAIVTKDKRVIKAALSAVNVAGGADCPEMSLGGIQLALKRSLPRSFVYVFTDATASDHKLVGKVLDMVQRKQSQVVFILTGHCNDLHKPSYKVYQQIAAASSGQVFNLEKTNVHRVLDFVKTSIKGRTVNLATAVRPAGYNYTQEIQVDTMIGEVTVSVSGLKPKIEVIDPSGEKLTGPPKLVTTLDLSEIMIVKVLDPQPGNYSITVGSEKDYSVKVVGLSNLTFEHGFSVEAASSMAETSHRPLQGTYNNMMVKLSKPDIPVEIDFAEILNLEGKTIFEVPLKELNSVNKVYRADAFIPPEEFFYIAINGHDQYGQSFRRIGSTAIQGKSPDAPFLTVPQKVKARQHDRVVLSCAVESLVPVSAAWTRDAKPIQEQTNTLQSTTIDYVIADVEESHAGAYRCVASNAAGESKATSVLDLIVDPPQVSIAPANVTVTADDQLTVICEVLSEASLSKTQIIFSNNERQNLTVFSLERAPDGFYSYNMSLQRVTEKDGGKYTCVAANKGGQAKKSTYIAVEGHPLAQILGPHTLARRQHSPLQLVCHVERCERVRWVGPGSVVLNDVSVNGTHNAVLDIEDVSEDGAWRCVAIKGAYEATDTVEVTVLVPPRARIEGEHNVTVLNGTVLSVACQVQARPAPRMLWHRETEAFLNHTVTVLENNTYRSVLTLDSAKEPINGTYFCFGENSEGIDQDSIIVNVRRKMVLLQGFTNQSVELYSPVSLPCRVDAHPEASVTWQHNGTTLPEDLLSEEPSVAYIQKVDFHNLGLYTCVADNGYESLQINGTLNVHGLESPVLFKEPSQLKIKKGDNAVLTCRILKGNPKPSAEWQYKSDSSTDYTNLNASLKGGVYEVVVPNADVTAAGSYRCVATSILGRDVYDLDLVVQFPPQLSMVNESHLEAPMELRAGDRKTLSCEASGLPPPIVTWTKYDQPVSFTNNVHLTDSNELVIEAATVYDSGVYACRVTNPLGTDRRSFTLLVYSLPEIASPEIEPEVDVLEGQLVSLPCAAAGAPPPDTRWLQNEAPVLEPRKYIDEFGLRFVANLTDFGEYTCIASNRYGNTSISYSVFVWVPPYIEGPVEEKRSVLAGSQLTLTCDAVGFPVPTIMWEFRGELLIDNSTSLQFNDIGNLVIRNASLEHSGVYACVAQNMVGLRKKYTLLRVDVPPIILDDFSGPYVATDMDTSLTIPCRAQGSPWPFVVWSHDDHYLDTDSRFVTNADGTLLIKSPAVEMSGEYTCLAKNVVGNVTRTVNVEIYPYFTAMQDDESQPHAVTLVEGSRADVPCPVRANRDVNVKWYKDAALVSTGTLSFGNVSRAVAATYACVASNAVASAHATVALTVHWAPRFVTQVLGEVEVVRGDDWYFDCKVDAKPAAKVKWYFNGKQMAGEEQQVLKLLNAQQHHIGTYKCVVSNEHGTVFRQYTLDVFVPPTISVFDLLDVLLMEGSSATLECNAKGSPTPEITWTYNNTEWSQVNSSLLTSRIPAKSDGLYPSVTGQPTVSLLNISAGCITSNTEWSQVNTTLSSPRVSAASDGLYQCAARNRAGVARLAYRVRVAARPAVTELRATRGSSAEIVGKKLRLPLGTDIRIACQATGTPMPIIRWSKYGNTLSENEDNISYADLVLTNTTSGDGGLYSCVASNEAGADERKLSIEVLEPPRIFQELYQNTNSSHNIVNVGTISGQPFYLHCHPSGNPMPEVYWFKEEAPLKLFDDSMVSMDYGETLVAREARAEQAGNYTCVARNEVGNTSVTYLVDVLAAPQQLKDNVKVVNTLAGAPLVLACPAEGRPAPSVTWIKHPYTDVSELQPRVVLSSDNYTLSIDEAQSSDSGTYSCVATNALGSAQTTYDVLVARAPTVAGAASTERYTVPLLRSVVLRCDADGHPPPKITWLKDVQPLSDAGLMRGGSGALSVRAARAQDAGLYICVAENSAGTALKRFDVRVLVPGKWSAWSAWGYCNATCGAGAQARERRCRHLDDDNRTLDKSTKSDKIILDESGCKGPAVDVRKCFMPPCENAVTSAWSAWSRWGACSATCGAGTQARRRRCRRARCDGDNVQIRKCPGLPKCEDYSDNTESNEVLNYRGHSDIPEPDATADAFETRAEVVTSHRSINTGYYETPAAYSPQRVYDVPVRSNLDHSARGRCKPGFAHNVSTDSCHDIDECTVDTNECHATQVCVNTLGGYSCACPAGYMALGAGQRCLDVNECLVGVAACEYACVNVAGGYVCACPRHLRLHADRRRCVPPALYRQPISYEDLDTEDYPNSPLEHQYWQAKNTR